MEYKEVFAQIDTLVDEYLKVWEDVCNIESPTKCKAGVDAVGDYFAKMAKARGWQIEYCRQKVGGDAVCITANPDADARPIVFSGHMDTVQSIGSYKTPAVHWDKEKIYGPGVTDCKGGIVAGFLAMDALQACGFTARPLYLLLQSDEEMGSRPSNKETIRYICEKSKDAIAFFNLEGHTAGEACLQRKGIVTYVFKVEGVEAHASKCATLGANAIAEAAHKILEIEKIKDADGVTCCCSVISGGTADNTVPGGCEFRVNVRFATTEQRKWIAKELQKIADKTYIQGCKTTLSEASGRMAMEYTPQNQELLDTINQAFELCGLPILKAGKRTGGSDAAEVTASGVPCLDSLGVFGGKIHTAFEFAYISSLAEAAKRLAAATLYMTKAQ